MSTHAGDEEQTSDAQVEVVGDEAEAPQPSAPNPRLVVVRAGKPTEEEFPFTPPAVLGRFDPSVGPVDVDLGTIPEGVYVSRKHARISEADGVYTLEDLGSSNGTYIRRDDFERVEQVEIRDGDEFALGNARFLFRTE